MKINDIVVPKLLLGTIVGKTIEGKWIVEWADTNMELGILQDEELFLVEETNGIPSKD